MASKPVYDELIPTFLLEAEIPPACAEANPDDFFAVDDFDLSSNGHKAPVYYANEKAAKAVCAGCPLKTECLIFALKTGQQGIWGGTTENERKSLRRKMRSF